MSWRRGLADDQIQIVRLAEAIARKARRDARKRRFVAKCERAAAVDKTGLAGARHPRERDKAYLAWIRRARCLACALDGLETRPVEAAHCRLAIAEAGWREPGLGQKPDDWKTTPWCRSCHDRQGRGERVFWRGLGLEPAHTCRELRAAFERGEEADDAVLRMAAAAYPSGEGRLDGRRSAVMLSS